MAKAFKKDNKKSVYNPELGNTDKDFQKWYKENTVEGQNGIPYSKNLDYDYYSYYKNTPLKSNSKNHFPDTYKKPNHPTFSNESLYSTPENPGGSWKGEKFTPNTTKSSPIIENKPEANVDDIDIDTKKVFDEATGGKYTLSNREYAAKQKAFKKVGPYKNEAERAAGEAEKNRIAAMQTNIPSAKDKEGNIVVQNPTTQNEAVEAQNTTVGSIVPEEEDNASTSSTDTPTGTSDNTYQGPDPLAIKNDQQGELDRIIRSSKIKEGVLGVANLYRAYQTSQTPDPKKISNVATESIHLPRVKIPGQIAIDRQTNASRAFVREAGDTNKSMGRITNKAFQASLQLGEMQGRADAQLAGQEAQINMQGQAQANNANINVDMFNAQNLARAEEFKTRNEAEQLSEAAGNFLNMDYLNYLKYKEGQGVDATYDQGLQNTASQGAYAASGAFSYPNKTQTTIPTVEEESRRRFFNPNRTRSRTPFKPFQISDERYNARQLRKENRIIRQEDRMASELY